MAYSNFGFYAPTTASSGTVGRGIQNIQSIDNQDGIITFNITYTDGLTQSASHSLVSDSLINLNKLTLEGTNADDKLLVRQFNGEPLFQVDTTEPGIILNGKTLINHDGLQYSSKFVIDANDGLLPCMRVSTVTNTTTIRDIDNFHVDKLKLTTEGITEPNKAIVMNANNDFYVGGPNGTLISTTGILTKGFDGIQILGDNNASKLIVRNEDSIEIFRISTVSDTAFINNIDNLDVNKLKITEDGYAEPNKCMITGGDNSIQMGEGTIIGPDLCWVNGYLRSWGLPNSNKFTVSGNTQNFSAVFFNVDTSNNIVTVNNSDLTIKGSNSATKLTIKDESLTNALSVNTINNTTTILNIDNVHVNKLKDVINGEGVPYKAVILDEFKGFKLRSDPPNDNEYVIMSPEGISVTGSDGVQISGNDTPEKFSVKDSNGNPVLLVNTSTGETTISLLRNEVYSNSASTGVVSGSILSIGTPNTTFSISNGYGYIVGSEVSSPIEWTGKTNIAVTNIGSQLVTYVLIGTGGIVYQQSTYPTAQQQREKIFIGVVAHVNQTIVDAVDNRQVFSKNPVSQLYDVLSAIGFLNIEGNIVSAFSNTLQIRKSLGKILASGANYYINPSDPHVLETPLLNPATWQYRLRNGFNYTGLNQGTIITTLYDVGTNVPATVPNNAWSIQRFYLFPSNAIKVMFSQFTYASKADALSVISSESFIVEPSILANGLFIGYLIVKKDTTDLSNIALAQFYSITKFGATSSAGAASSNLQASYNLSESNPEILTNSTQGGLNIRRGSLADTDIVFSIQNGGGTTVASMTGEGTLFANTVYFTSFPLLPSLDMTGYTINSTPSRDQLSQYFLRKVQPNVNWRTAVVPAAGVPDNVRGSCYAPYLNRIYILPVNTSQAALWRYYDCITRTFITYSNTAVVEILSNGAYYGLTYHAHLNRIYLSPRFVTGQPLLHYIDGDTGLIGSYPNIGISASDSYLSGVYSPREKRLYFVPVGQFNQPLYHYIDEFGVMNSYTHTINTSQNYYGAYDAFNNRIWTGGFNSAVWYYIDCDPAVLNINKVKTFTHGLPLSSQMLTNGVVFHPILNRMYFVPWSLPALPIIGLGYYIDLTTLTASSYQITHDIAIGFLNGFYLPTTGNIIFTPNVTNGENVWKSIDYQGNLKTLIDTSTYNINTGGDGFYDPINDFCILPYANNYLKIDPLCCERIDRHIMASAIMGN